MLSQYGFRDPQAALRIIRELAEETAENRLYAPRARKYLASGVRLFPLLDRQSRSCPETMVKVYRTLLDQIEKKNYDVLNNRVGLSKFQKFRLMAVIWLRARGLRFL